MARDKKYGKRIAGISFTEKDYDRIQLACERDGKTEAQVVRDSVSYGLGILESEKVSQIRAAAAQMRVGEHVIVRGAIREGLAEYLRMSRSRYRLRILGELRDDLDLGDLGEDDHNFNDALRDYLERHADQLENLMEEEQFLQKTIDREDEQQDEADRERQADFDKVTAAQPSDS